VGWARVAAAIAGNNTATNPSACGQGVFKHAITALLLPLGSMANSTSDIGLQRLAGG